MFWFSNSKSHRGRSLGDATVNSLVALNNTKDSMVTAVIR